MKIEVLTDEWNKVMKKCKAFVMKPKSHHPIFENVCISVKDGKCSVVALDGIKLLACNLHLIDADGEGEWIIPLTPVSSKAKNLHTTIYDEGMEIVIATGGEMYRYQPPIGEFMKYRKIAPSSDPSFTIWFDPINLKDSLSAFDKGEFVRIIGWNDKTGLRIQSENTSVFVLPVHNSKMKGEKLYDGMVI